MHNRSLNAYTDYFGNQISLYSSIAMSVSVCLSARISQVLNKSSAVTEMGDRLATIDTGRIQRGLLCPFP